MPAVDEIVTTRPERWARSCGSAARVTLTGPNRVVSICERNASGVISSKNPAWKLPALLTSTSSRPNRSTAAATAAFAAAGSVTSRATARRSSCSPSASAMLSARRAVATTACPAASAALARSTPRPRPAPVMSHTCLSVMKIASFYEISDGHPALRGDTQVTSAREIETVPDERVTDSDPPRWVCRS